MFTTKAHGTRLMRPSSNVLLFHLQQLNWPTSLLKSSAEPAPRRRLKGLKVKGWQTSQTQTKDKVASLISS